MYVSSLKGYNVSPLPYQLYVLYVAHLRFHPRFDKVVLKPSEGAPNIYFFQLTVFVFGEGICSAALDLTMHGYFER